MVPAHKDEKLKMAVQDASAAFIARNSGGQSMVTVTDVAVFDRGTKATIFVSVYPENQAEAALAFLKRSREELREYLKSHIALGVVPFIDVAIDKGEQRRQQIGTLLNQ